MSVTVSVPDENESLWFKHFTEQVVETEQRSETPSSEWRASGRRSKAWPNKEDETWWWENGPALIQAYRDWRASTPWTIWTTPANLPAIELDLNCSFRSVPVRAIIDRVFVTPTGELAVVDIKSGANPPMDQGLQLGFYASALEMTFGIRPSIAAYWNARKGGLSEFVPIDHLTPDWIGGELEKFVKARDLGIYIASPSNFCVSCGVRRACALVNGPEANLYREND